jgi:hypothetical protein
MDTSYIFPTFLYLLVFFYGLMNFLHLLKSGSVLPNNKFSKEDHPYVFWGNAGLLGLVCLMMLLLITLGVGRMFGWF